MSLHATFLGNGIKTDLFGLTFQQFKPRNKNEQTKPPISATELCHARANYSDLNPNGVNQNVLVRIFRVPATRFQPNLSPINHFDISYEFLRVFELALKNPAIGSQNMGRQIRSRKNHGSFMWNFSTL